MKKPTKTNLRNKLDTIFSKIVRLRDGKCMKCGKIDYLQACHIASRRFLSGRWNGHNCIALCAGCHRWGHDNPTKFSEWLKDVHPSVWQESIEVKAGLWKPKVSDYQELLVELKARLKSLEGKL